MTAGEVQEGMYGSLSQALEEAWFRYTNIWVLGGIHQWVAAAPRNPALPLDFPNRELSIKSLLCSLSDSALCTLERATIQLRADSPPLVVTDSLVLQSLLIQGNFPLKSNCPGCVYCPQLLFQASGVADDRGNEVNSDQAAEQSLCQGYFATVVISVRPGASLHLSFVSFVNIRYQPKALILSNCAHISLEYVHFSNVMVAKTGLLGAVIQFNANNADLSTCGSFSYRNGTVELLNNGYEIANDWNYSGFLRADKAFSVLIANVTFKLNHLPSALLHIIDSSNITIENCLFETNLVYFSTLYIEITSSIAGILPSIMVLNCTFQGSFGYQRAAIWIDSNSAEGALSLLNCTFEDVSAQERAVVEVRRMPSSEVEMAGLSFYRCSGVSLLSLESVGNVRISHLLSNGSGDIPHSSLAIASYLAAPTTYASLLPVLQPSACASLLLLDSANVTLTAALFTSGNCQSPGVAIVGNSYVSIANCSFTGNAGNGLISAWLWNDLEIQEVRFANNSYRTEFSSVGIAIVALHLCSVSITNASFVGNHGFSATVLEASGLHNLTITELYMQGNTAASQCAGLLLHPVANQASFLLLRNSRFTGNSAHIHGVVSLFSPLSAPTSATSAVLLQVLNCSFEDNSAVYGGSGLSTIGGVYLHEES